MMKTLEDAKGAIRKCFVSNVKYCYPLRSPCPHELNYVPHEKHVGI